VPTYGYQCTLCNEEFEVMQRITEDPLRVHDGCGGSLRRLLYPVGVVFKGPGFYVNDYARGGNGAGKKDGAAASGGDTPASKSEPKAEAKTETPAAGAKSSEASKPD
jgi:putative FmdB family regulatory protein